MLQNDAFRPGRKDQLGAARPARVSQCRLSFDQDHVGRELLRARDDCVLELSRDEVVGQRVEDDPEAGSLQPAGLAGRNPFRAHSRAPAGFGEHPGRRPLAERAVGPEDRHAGRRQRQDLARPEVEASLRPGVADVDDRDAQALRRGGDL